MYVLTVPEQLHDRAALGLVVVHDEQVSHVARDEARDLGERRVEAILVHGLLQERDGAGAECVLPSVIGSGHDVYGDVPCVGVVLQMVQHRPAVHHRQLDVEHDRVGLELVRQREPRVAARGDDPLEAAGPRNLEHGAGEPGIVVDDQHDAVARFDRGAIVLDAGREEHRRVEAEVDLAVRAGRSRVVDVELVRRRSRRRLLVRPRQVEGERAALSNGRGHVDLSAEQPRDLAADRQAETGAAVAAVRLALCLLERLEDQLQLVVVDPDARVDDREGERDIGLPEGVALETRALFGG